MSPINAVVFLWWLWLILMAGGIFLPPFVFEVDDSRRIMRLSLVFFGGLFVLSVFLDMIRTYLL